MLESKLTEVLRNRRLTPGEISILEMIQAGYGAQYTIDQVFFSPADEAIIFVKGQVGQMPVMANLTNLAAWRADGTISSDEDLKNNWLKLPSA